MRTSRDVLRRLQGAAKAIGALRPTLEGAGSVAHEWHPQVHLAVGLPGERTAPALCRELQRLGGAARAVSLHAEGDDLYAIESVEVTIEGVVFKAQFGRAPSAEERAQWEGGDRGRRLLFWSDL